MMICYLTITSDLELNSLINSLIAFYVRVLSFKLLIGISLAWLSRTFGVHGDIDYHI